MLDHYANRIADALERIADALENDNLGAINLNGDLAVTLGNGLLDADFTRHEPEPNTAIDPLDLEYGQVITFTYQGEQDDYPRQRRVRVDEAWGDLAPGLSYIGGVDLALTDRDYDEDEAYRRFRSDRIKSPIILVEQEAAHA